MLGVRSRTPDYPRVWRIAAGSLPLPNVFTLQPAAVFPAAACGPRSRNHRANAARVVRQATCPSAGITRPICATSIRITYSRHLFRSPRMSRQHEGRHPPLETSAVELSADSMSRAESTHDPAPLHAYSSPPATQFLAGLEDGDHTPSISELQALIQKLIRETNPQASPSRSMNSVRRHPAPIERRLRPDGRSAQWYARKPEVSRNLQSLRQRRGASAQPAMAESLPAA